MSSLLPRKGLVWELGIPSLWSFPHHRGQHQPRLLDHSDCSGAPGSLRYHTGVSPSPSAALSLKKRDVVTAQTSMSAFTDALHFALALPGCPFRPAPRVAGTSLTVTCQEPQPVSMARWTQPQRLWQQHVLTGMMTLGLIPSSSPGSHRHPDIPAKDRASSIS